MILAGGDKEPAEAFKGLSLRRVVRFREYTTSYGKNNVLVPQKTPGEKWRRLETVIVSVSR